MGRGGKRDYKPKRGGGKSFSKNLQPLDENGNEVNTPDRWEPRNRRQQDAEDSESESGSESEDGSGSGSDDDSSEDGLMGAGAPKSKSDKKAAGASSSTKGDAPAAANANRALNKPMSAKELAAASTEGSSARAGGEMSRRDREALEAKAAKERYWKLHQAGKTDQAKADLARLAEVKKRREEAARKRKEEEASVAEELKASLERSGNLGKKS
ncbi:casein kinase substrate phospho protein PP28-domain-containing protein [Protomyces lactucae-debilis]|uniref:Casein kinase substrate phospho protein PP28-domain-containing protein n=1 Tax=Protomyces lactucae-debilis TaxID=2754530 RepID=A0A1Y2FKE1_PROLT|nr:casein kinase substrate phospho protein PP28-domain-containing protein [Protomyces lactucae-debilis]ORY84399.1 casein kinase substrate phospho protein PP28-domain-containing protein [Protomyces lactucae-debilis]